MAVLRSKRLPHSRCAVTEWYAVSLMHVLAAAQYQRSLEALQVLSASADAAGRPISVIKVPLPPVLRMTHAEARSVKVRRGMHWTPAIPGPCVTWHDLLTGDEGGQEKNGDEKLIVPLGKAQAMARRKNKLRNALDSLGAMFGF